MELFFVMLVRANMLLKVNVHKPDKNHNLFNKSFTGGFSGINCVLNTHILVKSCICFVFMHPSVHIRAI